MSSALPPPTIKNWKPSGRPDRVTRIAATIGGDSLRTELGLGRALLTVTCQDLLARAADLGPVCLQATQYTERVVGIELQLRLAKPRHVRVAGGSFALISLRLYRRRLRWQLLSECRA